MIKIKKSIITTIIILSALPLSLFLSTMIDPEYEVVILESASMEDVLEFEFAGQPFIITGETTFEYCDEERVVTYLKRPTQFKWLFSSYEYNVVYIMEK